MAGIFFDYPLLYNIDLILFLASDNNSSFSFSVKLMLFIKTADCSGVPFLCQHNGMISYNSIFIPIPGISEFNINLYA